MVVMMSRWMTVWGTEVEEGGRAELNGSEGEARRVQSLVSSAVEDVARTA